MRRVEREKCGAIRPMDTPRQLRVSELNCVSDKEGGSVGSGYDLRVRTLFIFLSARQARYGAQFDLKLFLISSILK